MIASQLKLNLTAPSTTSATTSAPSTTSAATSAPSTTYAANSAATAISSTTSAPSTVPSSATSPSSPFDVGDTSDISIDIDVEIGAEGGYDIPSKGYFLDRWRLLKTLRSHPVMLRQIPDGHKNNKYFIIDNTENLERRRNKRRSRFWDDCGAWLSGPTNIDLFLGDTMTEVKVNNSQYCTVRAKRTAGGRRKTFTALEPQPDPSDIITLHRAYSKHSQSPDYRRRISWTDDREAAIAEYVGTFPGSAPHGNTKNARPRQYIRTKPDIMDTIRNEILTATPSEVMQARRGDDVVVGGLQRKKQIENLRYAARRTVPDLGLWRSLGNNIIENTSTS